MNGVVVDVLIRLTLLLIVGLSLSALLRGAPASLRYGILLATLGGSMVLPPLMVVSPAVEVGVLPPEKTGGQRNAAPAGSDQAADLEQTSINSASGVQQGATVPSPVIAERSTHTPSPTTSLFLMWMMGTAGVLVWLTIGHFRLRRIALESSTLDDSRWAKLFAREKEKAGVKGDVLLLCSPDVNTPITWGVFQPVVVLPEEALAWRDEHRRVVLGHELAHVARNDARSQLFAGVVCATYWFHPLVWLVERKLRAECERACDDRVVANGTPGSVYASHLLEVARSARSFGGPGFLSVAMARTSQLEGRLLAVLNESKSRDPLSRQKKILIAVTGVLLVATMSAFHPVPRPGVPLVHDTRVAAAVIPMTPKTPTAPSGVKPAVTTAVKPDSVFIQSVATQPGRTLSVDLPTTGGTLTVSAWDEPRVQVRGTLGGRGWRSTEMTLKSVADGVELRSTYTGPSGNSSFSHRFDIKVPRRYNVQLKSAGGGITILGLMGTFSGMTGGGEIEIQNTSGRIDLHTGGGDVHVANSALDGSIGTGGGAVRIEGNDGNLNGDSGTGDVISSTTTTNRRGQIVTTRGIPDVKGTTTIIGGDASDSVARFGTMGTQIRRSGGTIKLDDAPNGARVTTGGGPIRIGRSAGEVYASTGGGNIEIGPAAGSVIASTGAGDVTVVFSGGGRHAGDITSGLGQVVLVLPDNFSGTLLLESAYTNNFSRKTVIRSDWPLETTETTDWDSSVGTPRRYVRARKALGTGGGTIRVRTVNGDVIVRRAAATR